jgi:hypothetical protein
VRVAARANVGHLPTTFSQFAEMCRTGRAASWRCVTENAPATGIEFGQSSVHLRQSPFECGSVGRFGTSWVAVHDTAIAQHTLFRHSSNCFSAKKEMFLISTFNCGNKKKMMQQQLTD